jgi:hypothetical protein
VSLHRIPSTVSAISVKRWSWFWALAGLNRLPPARHDKVRRFYQQKGHMALLNITYDLHDSDSSAYDELYKAIQAFPAWCHVCESTWLIQANVTPIQARHYFSCFLRAKDKLFITPVIAGDGWATQGLSPTMVKWLQRQLGSESRRN